MNVLMLSKTFLVGAYQRQLEILARAPDVELVLVVPPLWREPGVGQISLERTFIRGYRLRVHRIALNGRFHLYFWPSLGRLLREERPDVLHIDEESFNLATFQAMRLGKRLGARCLFFNWANLYRPLPPPFCWMERYNLNQADYAVAGNRSAAQILRRKGYTGPLSIVPQVGVDAERFRPGKPARPPAERDAAGLTIGYVGRLVPQKGVIDLVEAVAGLPPTVHLHVVGSGVLETKLRQRAEALGLGDRVTFIPWTSSTELPDLYQRLDLLVLPSRTQPHWQEQFGRVLVEAMACGVAVVGSDSGEIPHVIGEAGRVFPEGDVAAMREILLHLLNHPAERQALAQRGRQRVLAHYTQERIAHAYLEIYREMVGPHKPEPGRTPEG